MPTAARPSENLETTSHRGRIIFFPSSSINPWLYPSVKIVVATESNCGQPFGEILSPVKFRFDNHFPRPVNRTSLSIYAGRKPIVGLIFLPENKIGATVKPSANRKQNCPYLGCTSLFSMLYLLVLSPVAVYDCQFSVHLAFTLFQYPHQKLYFFGSVKLPSRRSITPFDAKPSRYISRQSPSSLLVVSNPIRLRLSKHLYLLCQVRFP